VHAVAGVFLLGWITAAHVVGRWQSSCGRRSGLTLAACATLLIVSGYALYYSTGSPHEVAARVHEGLGVAALLAALAHWWRRRPSR
jgi:hypothetical protein